MNGPCYNACKKCNKKVLLNDERAKWTKCCNTTIDHCPS